MKHTRRGFRLIGMNVASDCKRQSYFSLYPPPRVSILNIFSLPIREHAGHVRNVIYLFCARARNKRQIVTRKIERELSLKYHIYVGSLYFIRTR